MPNYRFFTISKIPTLRILDFQKITVQERKQAELLFPPEQPEKK
jgi:hypothetical protein